MPIAEANSCSVKTVYIAPQFASIT
uniref:Uncharacterized protein n=1 Tax=Arundo donax TaxID=35708 RepID=A0A0A9AN30_ARUDO